MQLVQTAVDAGRRARLAWRILERTRRRIEVKIGNEPAQLQREELDRYLLREKGGKTRFRWRPPKNGSKSVVVLGAGWTCHPSMYTPIIEPLNRNHGVITVENAGHWNSNLGNSTPETYLRDISDDANTAMDMVNVKKAVLVGHSMWGFAARNFALAHPEKTAGVVFLCSPPANPLESWVFGNGPVMEAALSLVSHIIEIGGSPLDIIKRNILADNMVLRELVRALLEEASKSELNGNFDRFFYNVMRTNSRTFSLAFQAMLLETHEGIESTRKLGVPVLIITGTNDLAVRPNVWRGIAPTIPNSRLVELPVGHLPTMEAPGRTARLINEFISSCVF